MANCYRYEVALERIAGVFHATVPSVPGVNAEGLTEVFALENIKAALAKEVKAYVDENKPIPRIGNTEAPDYSKIFHVKIFV